MFEIKIASVLDREKLVAEIWVDNVQIVEIIQENDDIEIEFYNLQDQRLNFNEFMSALSLAYEKLKSPTN
ncbi:MAG: hypothetical protein ACLGGV_02765 [Bacteroidia bacterium]